MTEPIYSDTPNDLAWAPPGFLKGMHTYGFFVQPDYAALRESTHRRINRVTQGALEFEPLPWVLVSYGQYDRAYSLAPGFRSRGAFPYNEMAVWTFVVATKDVPGKMKRGSICVFVPYIYVDNQFAMEGGRAVLGFPKKMAQIVVPPEGADPVECVLTTDGFKTYGPEALCSSFELARAVQKGGPIDTPEEVWEAFSDAAFATIQRLLTPPKWSNLIETMELGLREMLVGFMSASDLIHDVRQQTFTALTFREMRDPADPYRATCQQFFSMDVNIPRLTGYPLFRKFDLHLHHADSDPVMKELGLKPVNTVDLAFWADMDAKMNTLQQLWAAEGGAR